MKKPFPAAALAAALALAAAGPARADTITIDFPGLADGRSVYTYLGQSGPVEWLIQSSAPASAVGPGNPDYAGTPGLAFPADWSVYLYRGSYAPADYLLDSIAVTVAEDSHSPPIIDLAGEAFRARPVVPGPSWSWSLASPGTYREGLGGFLGDTIDFADTGFWQVTSITIDYRPPGPAGGGGSVPEPSGLALGGIAAAILGRRIRRMKNPAAGASRAGRSARATRPGPMEVTTILTPDARSGQ